jgi:hypothetical protein
MRAAKPRKRFKHGAATFGQEWTRDAELRNAMKAVDDNCRFPKPIRNLTNEELHGRYDARLKARAIVRAGLRAQWAADDAERAKPLAPNIVRLSPQDARAFRENDAGVDHIRQERDAYIASVLQWLPTQQQRDAEIKELRGRLQSSLGDRERPAHE